MGYYMGDYYAGDYYRGDPGFFSALGGIGRRVAGVGVGLLPGGGAVTSLAKLGATALARRGVGKAGALARRAGTAIVAHPVISAAAGAGVIGGAASMSRVSSPSARSSMSEMIRRSHAIGASLRRRRRMNPYNPKALRRAVRRAHAFARMARHVLRFVSPKAPKGRMVFRAHRRKKGV
jgi:hypothetical protein